MEKQRVPMTQEQIDAFCVLMTQLREHMRLGNQITVSIGTFLQLSILEEYFVHKAQAKR